MVWTVIARAGNAVAGRIGLGGVLAGITLTNLPVVGSWFGGGGGSDGSGNEGIIMAVVLGAAALAAAFVLDD